MENNFNQEPSNIQEEFLRLSAKTKFTKTKLKQSIKKKFSSVEHNANFSVIESNIYI